MGSAKSRHVAAALLDLSVATGVILFVLRVVSFPRDTSVTVSNIIRTEGLFFLPALGPAVVMTVLVLRGSRAGRMLALATAPPYLLVLVFTSLVSPFDFERGGATLVGPEEPPWYATVYWISCVVLFAGRWFSGSSRFVARPEAQR